MNAYLGYTLLLTTSSFAISPAIYRKIPYDPLRDFAPAGTPQEIIDWLHREATAILHATNIKEQLAGNGLEVVASFPDEFAALIKTDIAKWTKLVKDIGIPLM